MTKPYNGHKNWTHWNVSLWINNDEGMYHHARDLASCLTRKAAAQQMLDDLHSMHIDKTPDGAKYSVTAIYHAMKEI